MIERENLTALDVAKYVVNYAREQGYGYSMTNLKLQKVLYFLWIGYYKKTKEFLFAEEFQAWQLGPVVPSVYYEYCCYMANPISEQNEVSIDNRVASIIVACLKPLLSYSAYDLVQYSHRDNGAWSKTYNAGNGVRTPIPFENIILEANI